MTTKFALLLLCMACFAANTHAQEDTSEPASVDLTVDYLRIGNFNGDNKADYFQKGKPSFFDPQHTPTLSISQGDFVFLDYYQNGLDLMSIPVNIFVGDFDGDGIEDLLKQFIGDSFTDQENTTSLLISDGKQLMDTVLNKSLNLNGNATKVYIGDFDGDGKADILRQITGDPTGQPTSSVLIANGDDSFFNNIDLPADFQIDGDNSNLFVGDFDGDKKTDILRQGKGDPAGDTCILFSNGDGTFKKSVISADVDLSGELTVADFNGDGIGDVLRRVKNDESGASSAELLVSDGSGGFEKFALAEDVNLQVDNNAISVGDFNGDGKFDLFSQVTNEGADPTLATFVSNGNDFEKMEFPDRVPNFKGVDSLFYVGDFDGDGFDDLMRYAGGNNMLVYYSNGDGTFYNLLEELFGNE